MCECARVCVREVKTHVLAPNGPPLSLPHACTEISQDAPLQQQERTGKQPQLACDSAISDVQTCATAEEAAGSNEQDQIWLAVERSTEADFRFSDHNEKIVCSFQLRIR